LAERGVALVVLKGMAYGLMFERGGPVRAMGDMDLLVRGRDFARAIEGMAALGFERFYPTPVSHHAEHHEAAFRDDEHMVEIHRAFLPDARLGVDYDGLWQRVRPVGEQCAGCWLLGAEDTLCYHCFHMGMHEFSQGLRPVWELRRLLLEDGPDLAAAAERARGWGTAGMTWCALRLCQVCFPGVVGDEDLARFAPCAPRRALLERMVVRASLPLLVESRRLPRGRQLLRKFLMVERPLGALSYLGWWLRARRSV
jgi:hypothetical protein